MLRSESLVRTDVKLTTGGSAEATVKNECGARLTAPSPDSVLTQAIGRGTTTAVSHG